MEKFELITGPSGTSELFMSIKHLKVGDKWMGSTVSNIRQLWEGGNYLIEWTFHNGMKSVEVMSKDAVFQKLYLEIAP